MPHYYNADRYNFKILVAHLDLTGEFYSHHLLLEQFYTSSSTRGSTVTSVLNLM